MKNIVLHTTNFKIQSAQLVAFENLYKKHNIPTFIFTKKLSDIDIKRKDELKKKGITLNEYDTKNELVLKIKKLGKSYIGCFNETLVTLVNEVKKELGLAYTKYYQAFNDKNLQRKLLLDYDKDITVNFFKTNINKIDYKKIKNIGFPLIIKPVWGATSQGVKIINSMEELKDYLINYSTIFDKLYNSGFNVNEILLEEFIDGTAWSIDYFVDEKQNIYITKPVFLEFGMDFGIDDFCNISRIVSQEFEKKLDLKKLKCFIKKNVEALGVRNTFVHHEFKFTNKGQFKTIELNGRIGGFRLDIYKQSYNFNLLELAFFKYNSGLVNLKLLNNYAIFTIYPYKEGIFTGVNDDILTKIKNLKSYYKSIILDKYLSTKIGFAKQGYSAVGNIKLKNKDFKEFKKDYDFIKKEYFNLLKVT